MGTKVGNYLVFSTIGRGTFGEVRLAKHAETGDEYAIKILSKSAIKANELTQNVRREIAIMKALNHRNIVNLREVLSSRSKLYIVMDLVRGGELFKQLDNPSQCLDLQTAHSYFIQLVDGVHYCHQRGVFHRDLKPENLLVDQDGTLKITDFGVSSMSPADLLYTACGTPYYCAPEIIRSAEDGYSGEKVDAWSCGIILYLLLTGSLPFFSEDYSVLYRQIDNCEVFYPPTMHSDAKDLISKLLTKNPAQRYSLAQTKEHSWYASNHNEQTPDESATKSPPVFEHGDPPSPPPPFVNPPDYQPPTVQKVSGLVQAWESGSATDETEKSSASPKLDARRHSAHAESPIADKRSKQPKPHRRHSAAVDTTTPPLNQDNNSKLASAGTKKSSTASSTIDRKKYRKRDLSLYEHKDLADLIKDALPGKSDDRIAKVVNAFVSMDIECAEDLTFLANMRKSPNELSEWLKENTQVPAITCMRIAQFLFV